MNKFTKTEIKNLHRIVDAISKSKKIKDSFKMDLNKPVTISEWWGDVDEMEEDIAYLKRFGIKAKITGKHNSYGEDEIEFTGSLTDFIRAHEEGGYDFESLGLGY